MGLPQSTELFWQVNATLSTPLSMHALFLPTPGDPLCAHSNTDSSLKCFKRINFL